MNCLDVEASEIDYIHIKFKCPICRTKYKKNGEPYARSKPVVHLHGSNGNLSNRVEHRTAHCGWNNKDRINIIPFNIHITKNTKRPFNYISENEGSSEPELELLINH